MRSRIRLAFFSAFVFGLFSCGHWRKGEMVLIPNGYTGWVTIEYGVSGAAALAQKDGRYLISIDGRGKAQTSTAMETGIGNDEYLYVDAAGKVMKLSLDGKSSGVIGIQGIRYITVPQLDDQKPRQLKAFFVGSEPEYVRTPRSDQSLLGSGT